jgi:hypothetical protein
MDLPLGRFLNAIYAWCCERLQTREDREQFDYRLMQPPPGAVSTVTVKQEMDAFSDFAAMFGVTAPQER